NNAGNSFQGTEVEIVGHGSSTVDENNEVCFDDVAAGVQRAAFTGPNHLTRRVRLNIMAGVVNIFDGVDLVEPGPFDVEAFDEIYRSFSVDGTVRWKTPPTRVLLDRDSLGSLDQGLAFFEDNVRRSFNTWLSNSTEGFFAPTPVTVGSIGPIDPEDFSCSDVPPGEIHIVGIDECPVEENFIILGSATHCFDTVGNEVVLGAIFFNPCSTVTTIEHEIIHTLCAGHLESRPNDSIMGSPGGAEEILPLDRRHMRYLYRRPAGTITPDDAWGLTPLEPMTSVAGTQLGSPAGDLFLPRVPDGGVDDEILRPSRLAPRPPAERDAARGRPEH
ncbi:MAG: hypothetical protein R3244_09075, partial [Thermoanaerobaculia bacterium]|nr:hypothetical protein [Thermoanaerobaculia bacterium]